VQTDRCEICVIEGDITALEVDVIVNAANSSLLGGGGVDGAIHRAAGPDLLEACRKLGGCPAGEARLTAGFRLPAHWIVHTVGPVWQGGQSGEAQVLASCYRQALEASQAREATSVAFPAISCGVYGYPPELAVRVAVDTVSEVSARCDSIRRVIFCCFDRSMADLYRNYLAELYSRKFGNSC